MSELIYMDHAATTPMCKEAVEAMTGYLREQFANPSAVYQIALSNRKELQRTRQSIAKSLNASENEIYFTGGGTESDNWALRGIAEAQKEKGRHIITTNIEHHAVLHTCQYLEKCGWEVTYLSVDRNGLISARQLERAIRPDTVLVSVMMANNEIGTIEPIRQLGIVCHRKNVLFHTDAVQAYGHIPIDVRFLNVDLLSASGHKFNGPKGTGFLYLRDGVKIEPLMYGGGQENHMRPGTENVAGIIGMGVAAEKSMREMAEAMNRMNQIRRYMTERILNEIPNSRLNGSSTARLPGNMNFSFPGIEGETLLIMLDMEGVCASSGSACTAGSDAPSHVLMAIGLPEELARGSLRLTIGSETTMEEAKQVADILSRVIPQIQVIE
ncbi:MAG: cysteine desulfurase family protein [Lachnospiraceae bacterium]